MDEENNTSQMQKPLTLIKILILQYKNKINVHTFMKLNVFLKTKTMQNLKTKTLMYLLVLLLSIKAYNQRSI